MGYNASLPPLMVQIQSFTEYRGLSYSIGGDANAFTIPNYIKHYQDSLTGYSIGEHIAEECNGNVMCIYTSATCKCNTRLTCSFFQLTIALVSVS
jgi:hypothetical protein